MTIGFFSWRWAPAVALVGGATALSVAASVFIPRSIDAMGTSSARAPIVTQRNDHAVIDDRADPVATTPEAPRRAPERAGETAPAGVESFFPAGPDVPELPPPLPDDPVPPEPVNSAAERDTFGPSAEPVSIPPP